MVYLTTSVTRTNADGTEKEITDWTSITIRKGLDQRANVIDITLKNVLNRTPTGETQIYHTWVGDDGELIWQENDVISIKCAWNDGTVTLSDTDTLTVADALEFNVKLEQQRSPITISAADKTFALLNQTIPRAFTLGNNFTSGEIIKELIETASENVDGDGVFGITANLMSESTYAAQKASSSPGIQTKRINNSNFPIVPMAKVYKPIYEWIDDLSTIESTNNFDGRDTGLPTDSEENPVQRRKMRYFVDKDNNFRWFYPDNDVDYTIQIGNVASIKDDIKNYSLKKSTFDVVNFVIYNGGMDLYGAGTLSYYFHESTTSKQLMSKYKAYNEVALILINEEIRSGNLVENTTGSFTFQGNRYDAKAYGGGGFTTGWGATVTSNDSYNTALRTEIDKKCKSRARALSSKRSSPRWKGSITIKGRNFLAGELINLTSRVHGINGVDVRINSLTHTISKSGWLTSVEVEEDEDEQGTVLS